MVTNERKRVERRKELSEKIQQSLDRLLAMNISDEFRDEPSQGRTTLFMARNSFYLDLLDIIHEHERMAREAERERFVDLLDKIKESRL